MYITISTGIGAGFMIDGRLSVELDHAEVGLMKLYHNGELQIWEDFASGRAFYEKTGKFSNEVDDPVVWQQFAKDVAAGLIVILPFFQPEVILIGGSVGADFEKYGGLLRREVAETAHPDFRRVKIERAENPEYAVSIGAQIYGQQKLAGRK